MLRSAVLVLCFTLFFLPLFFPLTIGDDGEAIVIGAEADTMIKDDFPNNNYGNITWQLEVQNTSYRHRLALFKFDLSTVPTDFLVTSAVLSLRVVSHSIDYPHVICGAHYYSGSWNETELTWNNFNFSLLNTEPTDVVDIYLSGAFNWTITPDVTAALNDTKILSEVMMVIYPYGEGYSDHTTFASREAVAHNYKPKLIIEGFMLDSTPPIISILFPENKTYPVNEVPLTFTLSETTSWMGYSLNDQVNVTISGNTTVVGLSDGTHTIKVYANDTAGNMGHSETVYFSIETPQPEPPPSEAFATWIVAAIVIVTVVGVALLIYFIKVKKTTEKVK